MSLLDIVVVIPAYNEQECIQGVIESWARQLHKDNLSYKILVINDGSVDDSEAILNSLASDYQYLSVIHQNNSGHGKAILRGYSEALKFNPQYVFQVDSDNQFAPSDFPKIWNSRNDSEFITGVRVERKDPLSRKVISSFLSKFINDSLDIDLQDANCPYRLMSSKFLNSAIPIIPHNVFAPNIFLSIFASKYLSKIIHVPVQHFSRHTGTNSLLSLNLAKACIKSYWDIFSLRFQLAQLLYLLDNNYMNQKCLVIDHKENKRAA